MDQHLASIPVEVRSTVEAARAMIRSAAPAAIEIPYNSKRPSNPSTMWKLARYAVSDTNVIGLGTFTRHSTIFFYRGRELDPGGGLLQGTGKDTRFMTLRSPAEAEHPKVRQLVRQAFDLALRPRHS